jgi:putative CocE/NonD family hydrolase
MRDGVEIAADVLLPQGEGPWPAVVNRTPYVRGRNLRPTSWQRLVDQDYVFVAVDQRGRGDSGGTFTPFVHDADDGHDVIEWVAAQPWCTGKVGMVGGSYEGLTQWWSAKGRPPHLACIVPQAVGAATMGPRWSVDTGVPEQYWIWWFNLVTGRTMQNPGAPSWEANWAHRPLRTLHEQSGTARDWWPRYVAGEIDFLSPDFALTAEDWARFEVPALIGVGWWDDQSTMTTWMALRESPAAARSRLLIGAWDHAGNLAPRPTLGGVDVSASVIDTIGYVERFLALHLKGDESAAAELSRCRIFRTGRMRWEELDDWPSPAVPASWYLGPDGTLGTAAPEAEGADSYGTDPTNPPRDFSNLDVLAWSDPPLDARHALRRDDVLVFTSDALDQAVDASGRAVLDCYVSVDAPDADLVVGVHDVYPDGRSIALDGFGPGILRLSFRDGADPVPLPEGEPVAVSVPLVWMHHTFLPGHRIRLIVTSTSYPNRVPNPHTGEPWADVLEGRPATVTVHHGPEHPSRLVLPEEVTP